MEGTGKLSESTAIFFGEFLEFLLLVKKVHFCPNFGFLRSNLVEMLGLWLKKWIAIAMSYNCTMKDLQYICLNTINTINDQTNY